MKKMVILKGSKGDYRRGNGVVSHKSRLPKVCYRVNGGKIMTTRDKDFIKWLREEADLKAMGIALC